MDKLSPREAAKELREVLARASELMTGLATAGCIVRVSVIPPRGDIFYVGKRPSDTNLEVSVSRSESL